MKFYVLYEDVTLGSEGFSHAEATVDRSRVSASQKQAPACQDIRRSCLPLALKTMSSPFRAECFVLHSPFGFNILYLFGIDLVRLQSVLFL